MHFRAVLELGGKTATGVQVPDAVVDRLGVGKRPSVRVTINSYSYPSTVASMGGRFMLPVSAEVRAHVGVAAGDEVDVEIELDTAPREVSVPPDLRAALAREPEAKRCFETLSYSNKRRIVLSIDDAKTAETRQRRLGKAVTALSAGRL